MVGRGQGCSSGEVGWGGRGLPCSASPLPGEEQVTPQGGPKDA